MLKEKGSFGVLTLVTVIPLIKVLCGGFSNTT